jgi:hypothetical protein
MKTHKSSLFKFHILLNFFLLQIVFDFFTIIVKLFYTLNNTIFNNKVIQ